MCSVFRAAPCILSGSADPQLQALFLIEHGWHHRSFDDWYNQVAVAGDRAPGWDAHYWGPGFIGWDSTKTFSDNIKSHFPKTKFEVVFMHWSLESDLVREAERDHHLDAVLRTLPGAPLLATIEHEMAEKEFIRYAYYVHTDTHCATTYSYIIHATVCPPVLAVAAHYNATEQSESDIASTVDVHSLTGLRSSMAMCTSLLTVNTLHLSAWLTSSARCLLSCMRGHLMVSYLSCFH
jgi:hypothetical protein